MAALAVFVTGIGLADPAETLKPMYTAVGPEGHLYYLASSYQAVNAKVLEILPEGSTSTDLNDNGVPDMCESGAVPASSAPGLVLMVVAILACATLLRRGAA